MVFFSHRTKRESPAGDQFWKFSRQCSIFGRIGDQWVAISSPEIKGRKNGWDQLLESVLANGLIPILESWLYAPKNNNNNNTNNNFILCM